MKQIKLNLASVISNKLLLTLILSGSFFIAPSTHAELSYQWVWWKIIYR